MPYSTNDKVEAASLQPLLQGQHISGSCRVNSKEDISSPGRPQAATRPKVIIALEAEVGGLLHVGNPSLAEDGAPGYAAHGMLCQGVF